MQGEAWPKAVGYLQQSGAKALARSANEEAAGWCAEVNGAVHSEICAVPAERLVTERELLAPLPSLRASTGKTVTRTVDRLSCVRFASR